METYEQMIPQFTQLISFKARKKWLKYLNLKQLKTFKEGLHNDPLWIPIIEELINQKIIETRHWKINQIIK